MTALLSPSLHTQQLAAGALWFLTSKYCSHIETQPDQLQPALQPLITHMSSENQELQENATGALANLAGHPTLQSWFTEAQDLLDVLLRRLVKGSPMSQANCAQLLEALAACHVPSHGSCQSPIITALIFLLTHLETNVQLVSLRILQKLLVSWFKDDLRARRVSTYDAQSQAYQAIQQFINSRGLVSLKYLLQKPDTEVLAAACLSCLVRLKLSWPAFASSGTFQLLLQRLALPAPSWESKAGGSQVPAADAVAILVDHADCAKIALQPPNLKLILQLFNAASVVLWEAGLQILSALIQTDESRQKFAAAGVMNSAVVESILFETAACCSSTIEIMQAEVLLHLSVLSSCQRSIANAEGIKYLSKKLDSPSQGILTQATKTICELAADDVAIRQKCTEGDIPQKLIRLLQSEDQLVQANAAHALMRLAINRDNETTLAKLGILPPLTKLLSSSSSKLRILSASAIQNICCNTEANRLQASELGALRPLIAMSLCNECEIQSAGRECLDTLAQTASVKQQIQALRSR